jgi:Leucine-rich repeat (LRR) protein
LEEIVCRDNALLTRINLSAALALSYLDCRNNSLTELETLYNPLLENLYCQNNQIKALDLSQNLNLAFLKSNDNQLETLDLRNGSNYLMTGGITKYDGQFVYVDGMDARNNPALLCIQVDNKQEADLGLAPYDSWFKDESVLYSENCDVNLGIDQQRLNNAISIFPNPAENDIIIKADNLQIEKVVIYSILGRSVKEYDSKFESLPVKAISPGIYLLRIYTENGVSVKRFIKK